MLGDDTRLGLRRHLGRGCRCLSRCLQSTESAVQVPTRDSCWGQPVRVFSCERVFRIGGQGAANGDVQREVRRPADYDNEPVRTANVPTQRFQPDAPPQAPDGT